jgi:uncharacterized protein (TIGR04255 family)
MAFPETPRVIYERNPLVEVICQLRFPPILRIDSDPPAAFQDTIRDQYPNFREVQPSVPDLPKEIVKIMGKDFPMRIGNVVYEFISSDEQWKISLARDFIALTAYKYERWEQFRNNLSMPLQALVNIYSPAFYTRIGLRYRDVIQRSNLGLVDKKWSELLMPHIAGELSSPNIAENVLHQKHDILIRLQEQENNGLVHLQHGLGEEGESGEKIYIIDSDFYSEKKTEKENAIQILDYFNKQAARLFRWCISNSLHDAMGPRPI